MRVSGNAFWMESNHWSAFCDYERELDRLLAGQKMIVLCTYPLRASRAIDLMDVARAQPAQRRPAKTESGSFRRRPNSGMRDRKSRCCTPGCSYGAFGAILLVSIVSTCPQSGQR